MDRCGAILRIGDDHGDNDTTFRCQLPYRHEGPHRETFRTEKDPGVSSIPILSREAAARNVVTTWQGDDREECLCGHDEQYHGPCDDQGNVTSPRCTACSCDGFSPYFGPAR